MYQKYEYNIIVPMQFFGISHFFNKIGGREGENNV
jgi:hypothetical protein